MYGQEETSRCVASFCFTRPGNKRVAFHSMGMDLTCNLTCMIIRIQDAVKSHRYPRSVCSALIGVLLLFSEGHRLHNPPLPLIFYSQCFPFCLALQVTANIIFLVRCWFFQEIFYQPRLLTYCSLLCRCFNQCFPPITAAPPSPFPYITPLNGLSEYIVQYCILFFSCASGR